MSVKFQLLSKKTNEPVSLNQVDTEICNLLDIPVHPKRYGGDLYNWYNLIGFQIAVGKPLGSKELRDYVTDRWLGDTWVKTGHIVLNYLENTYTSEAWA